MLILRYPIYGRVGYNTSDTVAIELLILKTIVGRCCNLPLMQYVEETKIEGRSWDGITACVSLTRKVN